MKFAPLREAFQREALKQREAREVVLVLYFRRDRRRAKKYKLREARLSTLRAERRPKAYKPRGTSTPRSAQSSALERFALRADHSPKAYNYSELRPFGGTAHRRWLSRFAEVQAAHGEPERFADPSRRGSAPTSRASRNPHLHRHLSRFAESKLFAQMPLGALRAERFSQASAAELERFAQASA